jgi:type II secretory pathway pseudopilin PulG
VVIGIIGILAAIVLVAVNPGRQFAQARNTQRQNDLLQITSAIYQFAAEHDGNLPGTDDDPTTQEIPTCTSGATDIGTSAINIGTAGYEDGGTAAGGTDGVDEPIVPTYIQAVPSDPSVGDAAVTTYTLCVDENGRLVATATQAELGATIVVTR